MNNTPTCPHCDAILEYGYIVDTNYDGSRHETLWEGYCPVCDRTFTWTEIYLFDRIENLEEEIDNG